MNPEWPKIRMETYRSSRKWPGWKDLFENHVKEDQLYFEMLDEEIASGKLNLDFEYPP